MIKEREHQVSAKAGAAGKSIHLLKAAGYRTSPFDGIVQTALLFAETHIHHCSLVSRSGNAILAVSYSKTEVK